MLARLMERLNDRRDAVRDGEEAADAGFTLIALMVVLLILAILLAIAIPTFLGVTGSANDRAAESNLNTALTDAKGVYESNQQSYPQASALIAAVQSNEPSLVITTDPASGSSITAGDISMVVSTNGNGVVIYTLAKKTQECWWVADNTQTIATTTGPWAKPITVTAGVGTGPGGVPTTAGEYYGVFKSSTSKACNGTNIGTDTTAVQSSGFPKAA